MIRRAEAAESRADQLHVQLAGCGVAALGGIDERRCQVAKKGDYEWSASFQDVVDLRIQWEAAVKLVGAPAKGEFGRLHSIGDEVWAIAKDMPLGETARELKDISSRLHGVASHTAPKLADRDGCTNVGHAHIFHERCVARCPDCGGPL